MPMVRVVAAVALSFLVVISTARGELASATPLPVGVDSPAPTPPVDSKPKPSNSCRWNECLWLAYPLDAETAEQKGVSAGCQARAKGALELDLTQFATQIPETHEWVLSHPVPLFDQITHLREQNACPSWPAGFEKVAAWDKQIGESCPLAGNAKTNETNGPLARCLSGIFLFRAAAISALRGDATPDSFQGTQTIEQVFHAELFADEPRPERLAALLDRFLAVFPGDVAALTRLTSVYFAAWARNPRKALLEGLNRTVARLGLYTTKLEELFPAELLRAIANGDALAMRRWALKLSEQQSGTDIAPYFLAWSSWLTNDRKESQSYLRSVLRNADHTWDLEARVGLKRLLSREPGVGARTVFFSPSVLLMLTINVPDFRALKPNKEFQPGDPFVALGPPPIALYASEVHAGGNPAPEVREALAEIRDGNRPLRTDLEDFLYHSALAAIQSAQSAVARGALRELLAVNPESAGGANLTKALELSEKLHANADDPDAALQLAQIWYQEKQYSAAAAQMRVLVARHPSNSRAQSGLQQYQGLENWQLRLVQEIQARPEDPKALYRYACILFREQRWQDAQRVLDQLTVTNPGFDRAEAMRRKIQWLVQVGDAARRATEIHAFLSEELARKDLEFPSALASQMLR